MLARIRSNSASSAGGAQEESEGGFTLIELLVVIIIIGILAAIAIPAYQDYLARAQMAEAVQLLASGKTPMAEFYANNGRWPKAPLSTMGLLSGRYTSAITMSSSLATTRSMTLTATMKAAGSQINKHIASTSLSMGTTDAGVNWACAAVTVPQQYMPGACR